MLIDNYVWNLPNAGTFNTDDACVETGCGWDSRKIKVQCPACKRIGSPLCSRKTSEIISGWTWIGDSHREPYSEHRTTCRCGFEYRFTLQTPQ